MAETTLAEFVAMLGDGWQVDDDEDRRDGYVTGPGGEKFWVDLHNINGRGMTCSMRQQVFTQPGQGRCTAEEGTALEAFAVMVLEAYPAMAERHAANLKLIEDIYKPIREFAADVAAHLGDGWTAEVGHYGADDDTLKVRVTLIDAQGREVYWRWGSYGKREYKGPFVFTTTDRWEISGGKYRGTKLYDVGYRDGNIGVSAKRTPKQVAGEITRRLLPSYYAAFDKAVNRDHAQAVYVRDRDAAMARVNKACPLLNVAVRDYKADDSMAYGRTYWFKFPTHNCAHVEAAVSGHDGGTVDLAFNNIPVGAAEALLEAWKGIVAAHEGDAPVPDAKDNATAPSVLVEVSGGCVQSVFAKGLPKETELCVVDYDNDEYGNASGYCASCWDFDVEPDAETRGIFRETAGRDW